MADYSSGNIVYDMSIDAKNLFENADKAKKKLGEMEGYGDKAAKGLDKVDKSAQSAGDSLGKLTTIAKAVGAALFTSKIIAYAESWNELEDRIQNTGATASQTKDILERLTTTSNRNGRKINESAELYIRLSNSMRELGYSTNDTLSYIDSMSNLMTINKTGVISSEAAINALTKAQMKGKLSGVEAMTVFNSMPFVLGTLVNYFKKTAKSTEEADKFTEAYIKTLANDGKLTMETFTSAMIGTNDELASLADNMRNNIGDGLNRIENNLKQFLGELNNSTGATKMIVDSLILVSEHADIVVNVMGVLAAIYAGRYVTSITAAAMATLRQSSILTMLTTRAGLASVAMRGLSATMNMLGGPAGILLIAVGALASWGASANKARKNAIELGDAVDELAQKFATLSDIQKEAAVAKWKDELVEQNKQIENQERLVEQLGYAYQRALKVSNGNESDPLLIKATSNYKSAQADLEKIKVGAAKTQQKITDAENGTLEATTRLTRGTNELTGALKDQDGVLSKGAIDNIANSVSKLAQETEIASLKQNKLNKEAYVYQNVLSTLGDDADKYQAALLKAAQSGELFKGNIEGMPEQVYPLIAALSALYDVNNSGSVKTDNAASKIKELKDNIAVARLEVQGAIKEAKELKALQDAKSTSGTAEEINQIIALTKEYEKLELAKSGKSFAQEQIDNGMTGLEKIDNDEQAKLTKLNEWRATGLANEQTYQDALTAIVNDAAKQRQQIDDDAAAAQQANMSAILSSASALFGGMSDLISNFSNDSSSTYKAMFALSKGFAVANAALNLQSAIMQAMADPTALTPAQKFANYTAIASAGGSLLNQISSINYGGGREHGGDVNSGSFFRTGEGNKPELLIQGNRQYLIPGENGRVISNKDISNGQQGLSLNVIINNAPEGTTATMSDNNTLIINQAAQKGAQMGFNMVNESISSHTGGTWRALSQSTNTKAKL